MNIVQYAERLRKRRNSIFPSDPIRRVFVISGSPDLSLNASMTGVRSAGSSAGSVNSFNWSVGIHLYQRPRIDSLRDSQIRESLTRCWLLKEEQHRWVQRLRSDGLI